MSTDLRDTETRRTPDRLTRWLGADAVVTGLNAVGYLVLAGWLSGILGPETGLLRGVGVFLTAFTLVVIVALVTRSIPLAVLVIVTNAAWTAASAVVLVSGPPDLTGPGQAWTLLQAVVVGALGTLQFRALSARRGSR